MAAFADYLDLRIAVAELVNSRAISDVFPRLVQLAEARLNKELRCQEQMTEATVTFTSGVADLPADFLEVIGLFDSQGNELKASAPSTIKLSGTQYRYYAIRGSSILNYGYSGDRTLLYYAEIATIADSPTSSNWLLASHPDVYLYAVAVEAAKFIREPDQLVALEPLLEQAKSALKVNDDRHRWANAVVRVGGVVA